MDQQKSTIATGIIKINNSVVSGLNTCMALTLNPSDNTTGIVRHIVDRQGSVADTFFIDKSALNFVTKNEDTFVAGGEVRIEGLEQAVAQKSGLVFLGPEDPDIYIGQNGTIILYFTMPFLDQVKSKSRWHLATATGSDLAHLKFSGYVLPETDGHVSKELVRISGHDQTEYGLVESGYSQNNDYYSTIDLIKFSDQYLQAEYVSLIGDPQEFGYEWCARHLSPGTLWKASVGLKDDLILLIVNGRSSEFKNTDGKIKQGKFLPGLMVFNIASLQMEWLSEEPLFDDTDAKSVVFTSDNQRIDDATSLLYAHIDDEKVVAYQINHQALRQRIPAELLRTN